MLCYSNNLAYFSAIFVRQENFQFVFRALKLTLSQVVPTHFLMELFPTSLLFCMVSIDLVKPLSFHPRKKECDILYLALSRKCIYRRRITLRFSKAFCNRGICLLMCLTFSSYTLITRSRPICARKLAHFGIRYFNSDK